MKTSRKDKLIKLQEYINLETGQVKEDAFVYENLLYEKSLRKKNLDDRLRRCDKCDGMNIPRLSANCSGFINVNSPFFFVGQSLHRLGMYTNIPFIKGSGYLVDDVLHLVGLTRYDVYIANVVACHPPNNRASTTEEKNNCLPYLQEQLEIIDPKMIICLGADAKWAVEKLKYPKHEDQRVVKVAHPASFSYAAPEKSMEWVIKLASELEKML